VVASLGALFSGASVIDRRGNPSYGYRAVHLVIDIDGKLVEIQVRTELQHQWAELSEKLSDVVDPAIKYGGGPAELTEFLRLASEAVAGNEEVESQITKIRELIVRVPDEQERGKVGRVLVEFEARWTQAETQIRNAFDRLDERISRSGRPAGPTA
jgi:hypothetical protein